MNAPLDEIRMVLGNIPEDEFEQRRRIRLSRTIASSRALSIKSAVARQLLWMVCDTATANLFASMPLEQLEEVATFCRGLLALAAMAERLEAGDGQ